MPIRSKSADLSEANLVEAMPIRGKSAEGSDLMMSGGMHFRMRWKVSDDGQ
jgi:hypothetical protein